MRAVRAAVLRVLQGPPLGEVPLSREFDGCLAFVLVRGGARGWCFHYIGVLAARPSGLGLCPRCGSVWPAASVPIWGFVLPHRPGPRDWSQRTPP